MEITALYACVASNEIKPQPTVEAQLQALRKYAKEKGYPIANEYTDDNHDNGNLLRPGLGQLLEDMRDGKFSMVLTKNTGRWAHKVIDYLAVFGLFNRYGIVVEYLESPCTDCSFDVLANSMLIVATPQEKEQIKLAIEEAEKRSKHPMFNAIDLKSAQKLESIHFASVIDRSYKDWLVKNPKFLSSGSK